MLSHTLNCVSHRLLVAVVSMAANADEKVVVADMMVAVIDANGVRSGRVEPNLEVLDEEGFLVVDRIKLLISEEQASALTSDFPEPRDFLSGTIATTNDYHYDYYYHYYDYYHHYYDYYYDY